VALREAGSEMAAAPVGGSRIHATAVVNRTITVSLPPLKPMEESIMAVASRSPRS
jgi:hypothetical protein